MEYITTILEWKCLLYITIVIFLFYVMNIIGNSICKLFKNVGCLNRFLLAFMFLLLILQIFILEGGLLDEKHIDKGTALYFASILAVFIMIHLFSRKNKINHDFIVIVGIGILMQTIISMIVSSNDVYSFNIKFLHGIWYISLPAFLIYEISNSKKDFSDIHEKLKIIQEKLEIIHKNTQKNYDYSSKKLKKHKCIFFK